MPCAIGGAAAGAAQGARVGAFVGSAVEVGIQLGKSLFGDEQRQLGDALRGAGGKAANTRENRGDFGDFVEGLKAAGEFGTKNAKGDFTFRALIELAKRFLGGMP